MAPSPIEMFQAGFDECRSVHDFLQASVRLRLEGKLGASPQNGVRIGLFLRGLAWAHTLTKLNHPADFQALAAASRALFETAIDLALLHFDAASHPTEKILAWEDSAKLKAAQRTVGYRTRVPGPAGEDLTPMTGFIAQNRERVERLRLQYWPSAAGRGRHPDRWTGRTLDRDAIEADRLFPDGEFEEFYGMAYALRCWNTHGSALVGVRFIESDEFPALSALALKDATHFLLVTGEIALRAVGLWNNDVEREFEDHHARRILSKYAALFGEDSSRP